MGVAWYWDTMPVAAPRTAEIEAFIAANVDKPPQDIARMQDEDFGFTRTRVPVAFARYGIETLIFRSQAKRLVARFERFKEVVLDFKNVPTIGQAFADEVFRVFPAQHPNTRLVPINAEPDVERMIRRALANAREDLI